MDITRLLRPYKAKKSKYHNKKCILCGITFDSKLEAQRWLVLQDMQKQGKIYGLELQKAFPIGAGRKYLADFYYKLSDSKNGSSGWNAGCDTEVVEDVKGVETAVFRLKMALFNEKYPNIKFYLVKKDKVYEVKKR